MGIETTPPFVALTNFVNDPGNRDILALVKGLRNGLVYGAKIRFPHSLVMTMLFRSGPFSEKMRFVYRATKQHARNLGLFVLTFKTMMLIQKKAANDKQQPHHAYIAGGIGGYLIFGREKNNVNEQIVLYIFSRIMTGLARLSVKNKIIAEPKHSFSVFAAVTWAIVMGLFFSDRDVLQPSLQASMQYLYLDSNKWTTLKNFIWHNK